MSDKKDSASTSRTKDAEPAKTPAPGAPAEAAKSGDRELADNELDGVAGGRRSGDDTVKLH